jgi:hypothetical protein
MTKRKVKSTKQFDPSKYVGATKFQTRFRPVCRFFFHATLEVLIRRIRTNSVYRSGDIVRESHQFFRFSIFAYLLTAQHVSGGQK